MSVVLNSDEAKGQNFDTAYKVRLLFTENAYTYVFITPPKFRNFVFPKHPRILYSFIGDCKLNIVQVRVNILVTHYLSISILGSITEKSMPNILQIRRGVEQTTSTHNLIPKTKKKGMKKYTT